MTAVEADGQGGGRGDGPHAGGRAQAQVEVGHAFTIVVGRQDGVDGERGADGDRGEARRGIVVGQGFQFGKVTARRTHAGQCEVRVKNIGGL